MYDNIIMNTKNLNIYIQIAFDCVSHKIIVSIKRKTVFFLTCFERVMDS